MPHLDYATSMRIRVLVGSILSVAIVGSALLLSESRPDPASAEVRLASASALLAIDTSATDGADEAAVGGSAPQAPAPGAAAAPAPAAPPRSTLDPSYVRAARTCPGLEPAVLAAIHTIETRRGQDRRTSSAGAVGPMQFLSSTWAHYGIDGNGDGRADIRNFSDALFSAARYLCANGGGNKQKLPSAIWNYNHSRAYVSAVLRLADQLKAS